MKRGHRETLPHGLGRFKQTVKRYCDPLFRAIRFNRFVGWRNRRHDLSEDWYQALDARTPVFVFQMGKVASTSIYRSLDRHYEGCVFHGHYFSPTHNDAKIRALYKHLVLQEKPAVKIISLIREPISRNISAYFQNFKRDNGVHVLDCGKSMVQLREMFLLNYPHEIPWVWFDNNIKRHFGIDVYEKPFPTSGHLTFRNDNVELLLLRHDLEDELKQCLVGNFVGLESLEIERSNVSADKKYHEFLEAFMQLKMPKWYLYRVFSSKYTKHFYQSEMGSLMRQWQEPDEQAA